MPSSTSGRSPLQQEITFPIVNLVGSPECAMPVLSASMLRVTAFILRVTAPIAFFSCSTSMAWCCSMIWANRLLDNTRHSSPLVFVDGMCSFVCLLRLGFVRFGVSCDFASFCFRFVCFRSVCFRFCYLAFDFFPSCCALEACQSYRACRCAACASLPYDACFLACELVAYVALSHCSRRGAYVIAPLLAASH